MYDLWCTRTGLLITWRNQSIFFAHDLARERPIWAHFQFKFNQLTFNYYVFNFVWLILEIYFNFRYAFHTHTHIHCGNMAIGQCERQSFSVCISSRCVSASLICIRYVLDTRHCSFARCVQFQWECKIHSHTRREWRRFKRSVTTK